VPVFFTVTTWATLVAAVAVAGKAIDVGVNVMAGAAAAAPVPVRLTVWGDPVALSAINSEAANAPAAAGLNSTETEQVAPAASDVEQVFAEIRKEVAPVPVIASDVRVSAAVPEFFTVTICAAVVTPTVVDAKVRLVGVRVTAGVAATPVPVRATVCGDPVALSAIDSEAANAPAAAGLNSTDTVQVAAVIHRTVHRQDHRAADMLALAEHRGKPVGAQGIALLLQLVAGDAETAEIEPHLPALAEPLGNEAPAATRAQTRHVAVQVHERRDR